MRGLLVRLSIQLQKLHREHLAKPINNTAMKETGKQNLELIVSQNIVNGSELKEAN